MANMFLSAELFFRRKLGTISDVSDKMQSRVAIPHHREKQATNKRFIDYALSILRSKKRL